MTTMSNKNEDLMNVTMYDALISANVEQDKAREAAIEAGRNDLRFLTVGHSIDELRSHVDTSLIELRSHVDTSLIELRSHVDTSMTDLRSHVDTSMTDLRSHVDTSHANLRADIIENVNSNSRSNLIIILGALAVAVSLLLFFS